MSKFFEIKTMSNGEVRMQTDLFGEEIANGVMVRGFTTEEALEMAAQIVEAAKKSTANRALWAEHDRLKAEGKPTDHLF